RALAPGAYGRRILVQRELEERMQLDALAAAPGIVHEHASGTDVARPAEGASGHATRADSIEHPQVPVAELPTAVRHLPVRVEQSVEDSGAVGVPRGREHIELEIVVEARVHELELHPGAVARGLADPVRNLGDPAQDPASLIGEGV